MNRFRKYGLRSHPKCIWLNFWSRRTAYEYDFPLNRYEELSRLKKSFWFVISEPQNPSVKRTPQTRVFSDGYIWKIIGLHQSSNRAIKILKTCILKTINFLVWFRVEHTKIHELWILPKEHIFRYSSNTLLRCIKSNVPLNYFNGINLSIFLKLQVTCSKCVTPPWTISNSLHWITSSDSLTIIFIVWWLTWEHLLKGLQWRPCWRRTQNT